MINRAIKYSLYILSLLAITLLYLSYFGIKTERFNDLIIKEILRKNEKVKIELESLKILLNLKELSFNLKTTNPKIIYDKNEINLKEITTNFSLKNFINNNFTIEDLRLSTKNIKIKDIIAILRTYKDNPRLFFLEKIIKDGFLIAEIKLNFDNKGKINKDYEINGFLQKGELNLLNKKFINDLNFEFKIRNKEYSLNKVNLKYEKLELLSNSINIENKGNYFFVNGNIENNTTKIEKELLNLISKNFFKDFNNVNLNAKNKFSFKLNKRFKINDFKIESDIVLNKADYKIISPTLKNYLPKFKELIRLNNHKISLIYDKNKLSLKGKGNFIIDNKSEIIDYDIIDYKNRLNFNLLIQIKDNPIFIDFFNYKKKKNINSILKLEGLIDKKKIYFKNISFEENLNKFFIYDLNLNKDYKINSFNEINLDFTNTNNKKNKIKISKNNKDYEIKGEIFDAHMLIDQILKNDGGESSRIFNNFNSSIDIKIKKTYLDNKSFINDLKGNLFFKDNKIDILDLQSEFSNKKKLTLAIRTNENNEKITTLFSSYPKPLVKRYKFIKGFEEGILDFQSIKKNNVSKSLLVIDNFKVKEVPALAKLLTLASLQGIADLLTGEGIRFTDFEMKFSNKGKLMTIDEIYAIGPAISIMMEGYVESEKLISLRGTLVPATTINRTISSIPLIGSILVGKKAGEGIFGVSFKIKGPPENLKTTVNPIKTLTPRFITRTLEKIKKN